MEGSSIEQIILILEFTYGSPRHGNFYDPLDELIYIKLSQQTNAVKFNRVYLNLIQRFGSWTGLFQAEETEIADALHYIGFHKQRARQLKAMLGKIYADRGVLDLGWLKGLPNQQAIDYLLSLPGVGIKTAYCVAMYALDADVLPVDTHVERVASRLGIISPQVALRSRQGGNLFIHRALNALIPPGKRYSFHVNCVAHGRALCKTKQPRCSICPLNSYCEFYQRLPKACS